MSSTNAHRVIFLGDSSVGKTSIINQIVFGSYYVEHKATIGIDFFLKTIDVDGNNVQLQIWDTAGQERFHALVPSYVHNSTVAIFVYDITSRSSFENLQKWHQLIGEPADSAFFVVGNKLDLESGREVAYEEGKEFADGLNAKFIETSARTPINIVELFDRVARVPIPIKEEPANVKQTIQVKIDTNSQNENQKYGCGC